ncbi:hypothetical protein ABZ208_13835 [Streptomyces sp. NPDC006208]|uniref:hypothetical protein n=1 Tax=Streptomyces sp. NPDC006208 TaxID=3156734 RepID=UPI0033B8D247
MPEPQTVPALTTAEPVEQEPAESTVATTPATVADCRADYKAGADVRERFDATAKRQYRR